jgi:hypothetical protein
MSLDLPIFCPDDKFGPHIGPPPAPGQTALTCRGGFDFTLLFEESILSIPLSIILLIVLPFRILQLIRQPVQVGASVLRPLKVVRLSPYLVAGPVSWRKRSLKAQKLDVYFGVGKQ